MTLLRIELPGVGAEAVAEQPHNGVKVVIKGGEHVHLDLEVGYPTTVRLTKKAPLYQPMAEKEPRALEDFPVKQQKFNF